MLGLSGLPPLLEYEGDGTLHGVLRTGVVGELPCEPTWRRYRSSSWLAGRRGWSRRRRPIMPTSLSSSVT